MRNQIILPLMLLSLMTACSSFQGEAKFPTGADRGTTGNDIYEKPESVFGAGGLMGLNNRDSEEKRARNGINVNAYLWRATLDTISFMPLASADPFGGVIITEWYTSPEKPGERLKLNVFILNDQLVADGVSVKVFRQAQTKSGWVDAKAAPETGRQLEDAILTRARQLRIAEQGK
jgi:hypothetical protein